jgi:hypothetical protein
MRLAVRVFGGLSRMLLPRAFTARYGVELIETFAQGHRDARRRSRTAALSFTMREVSALVVTAVRERRALSAPAVRPPERQRGVMWNMLQDVAFAVRITRRSPLYATVVALTLAVGIGVNLAVWTVLNAVLLRPLPYADAHELVQIWNVMTTPAVDDMTIAPADYIDFRERARVFDDIAAHNLWFPTVGDAAAADRVLAGMVTSNFFPLLCSRRSVIAPSRGAAAGWCLARGGTCGAGPDRGRAAARISGDEPRPGRERAVVAC